MNDVRLDADCQKLDNRNFMDDEELALLHHKRDMNVPDNPGLDVRDGLDTTDTQQEDWLLQTEPLHGANPRRTATERPPLIDDHTGVMDLEATGGTGAGRWRRASDFYRSPSTGCWSGPTEGAGSPVDMLVDTVAQMQLDLADLRAENRMLSHLQTHRPASSRQPAVANSHPHVDTPVLECPQPWSHRPHHRNPRGNRPRSLNRQSWCIRNINRREPPGSTGRGQCPPPSAR